MKQKTDSSLHLDTAPGILFLFGLSGSGKSHIGKLIAAQADWQIYDADEDITDEMRKALEEHRAFTDAMRDDFFSIVVQNVLARKKHCDHLLVTQAVYKQRHRDYLLSHIPDMDMIYIQSDAEIIALRLHARTSGISVDSANALRNDFELPAPDIKTLINDGSDSEIIRQLNAFYSTH